MMKRPITSAPDAMAVKFPLTDIEAPKILRSLLSKSPRQVEPPSDIKDLAVVDFK